jgi:MoxR-like ATPase
VALSEREMSAVSTGATPHAPRDMTPEAFRERAVAIEQEVGKVIVGQRNLVHQVLVALVAGGNVLLEGVPGLGKTVLVRTLADVIDCQFSRVQFTPT